jgi:hypothetical protein
MDIDNPWKLVKAGFWLGIGFIIPTMLVQAIGTAILAGGLFSLFDPEDMIASDIGKEQIVINEYKDVYTGNQVVINGSLTNTAEGTASSIELEAEMYDKSGEFVYECSEYISDEVEPGNTENFQIKCGGCSDTLIPEYDSVKVRVVSVSDF